MKELKRGDVVLSLAGHDQGGIFVIYDIIDDDYVLIADGQSRSMEKPKRKKRKHLKVLPQDPMDLDTIPRIMNSDIRKFLKKYTENA